MRGKPIVAALLAAMITAGSLLSLPVYAAENTAVVTSVEEEQATTATVDYATLNQKIKQGAAADITTKTVSVKNIPWVGNSGYYGNYATTPDLNDFFDYKGNYTIAYSAKDGYVYIVRFNDRLEKIKTLKIKPHGGCRAVISDDKGNYYMAWGKQDEKGKGGVVTFAISKYNYNGEYLSTCSYKSEGEGWDTRYPFVAGTCAMTIQNNVLVCSYAREMYNGHQSNEVFAVNINTMKETNAPYNYVSHSFNQRLISLKQGGFLYADHGDAYPRGFQLHEYLYDKTEDEYESDIVVPFHFYGETGLNYTNAYLGDIGETTNDYVLIATSAKSMTKKMEKEPQQLFLQLIDKKTKKPKAIGSKRSGTSGGKAETDTGVKWLTNYTDGSSALGARMLVLENNNLFVAWEKYNPAKDRAVTAYYMILSPEGKILQNATMIPGREFNADEGLEYRNGKIYWTTSVHNNSFNTAQIHTLTLGSVKNRSIKDTRVTFAEESYRYDGTAKKPKPQVEYGGKKLKEGSDYKIISYKNNKNAGIATVKIQGKGKYSGTTQAQFKIMPAAPTNLTVSKTSKGYHQVKWSPVKGADGYQIHRICAVLEDGYIQQDFSKLFSTTKTSYLDKLKKKNATFIGYTVCAYKTVNGEKIFGPENYYYLPI